MIKGLSFAGLFILLVALWLAGLWTGSALAQQPAPPGAVIGAASAGEKSVDVYQQSFDIVWRTVKEKHFDPKFGGIDWDKVREEFAPRAATVKSDQELYRLLQEMLGRLHQSHFNIIPPASIIPEDQREPSHGGIGIDIRLINGAATITRLEPDRTAARAGLRLGYIIKQMDQKTVNQIVESFAMSIERPELKNVRITRRILAAINGAPGTAVKIVYLDDKDQQREATITRERLKGELSPPLGNFPPQYTEFEFRRLARGAGYVGYIRFNIFTAPVIEKSKAAISEFSNADGIIFDLRGNPGGVGGIAMTIAGRVCEKGGSLGTMKMRSGELKFTIFPQANPYTGPVVILIDGLSGSTSEVFSSGMQEIGRAVIVGERSAGAALPSFFQKLPTGALFQFAIADFRTSKGVLIEGRGVIPDVEVKRNRSSLLAGRDAQLDAAIEQALQSKRKLQRNIRR
jgi:carboxyl-terminal processing protease